MLTTVNHQEERRIWYPYTVSEVKLLTISILKATNHSFNATQISVAIYRLTAAQTFYLLPHVKFLQNKRNMGVRKTTWKWWTALNSKTKDRLLTITSHNLLFLEKTETTMKHPNFKNGQKAVFPFVFFFIHYSKTSHFFWNRQSAKLFYCSQCHIRSTLKKVWIPYFGNCCICFFLPK